MLTFYLTGSLAAILGSIMSCRSAFKKLRAAAPLAGIRETPVCDMGAGMAQVFGKVEGDDPLISPLTGVPCFYYKATAEELVGGQWRRKREAAARREFYLNDGTARVRIIPQGADFVELTTTFEAEMDAKSGSECSWKIDPSLPRPTEERCWGLLITDWAQAPVPGLGLPPPPTEQRIEQEKKQQKAKWWEPDSIEIFGLVEWDPRKAPSAYRLSEHVLMAGRECSIFGTCDQGQETHDGQEARVIRKGKTRTTFVISGKRGNRLLRKWLIEGLALTVLGVTLLALLAFLR